MEVLIGATISSFLMVGVLSTFLLMGRTSANIINYTDLESKGRKVLEMMGREVHNAYAVSSYSGTALTLSIPDTTASPKGTGTGAYTVTYTFDTGNKRLTRTGPPIDNPSGASTSETLLTGVELMSGASSYFNYYRYISPTTYTSLGEGYEYGFTSNYASNVRELKQIGISFVLKKQDVTVTAATNKVLSARFILRNK